MPREKTTLRTEPPAPSPSELAKNLGRRLRYLRAQSGVTQSELSNRAATSRAYLSKLERGKILPRYFTLARLAACLGVHPVELVRDEAGHPRDKSLVSRVADVPQQTHSRA